MKLDTPLIAILIASFFFITLFTMFVHFGEVYRASGYDVSTDDLTAIGPNNNQVSLTHVYDKINETKTNAGNIEKEFNNVKPSFDFSSLSALGSLGYYLMVTIKDGVGLYKEIFTVSGQIFGVDLSIGFTIILLVVIISIILVIMGATTA